MAAPRKCVVERFLSVISNVPQVAEIDRHEHLMHH